MLVGFCDGAWKASECKGGKGGIIFSKASVIVFYCTGPVSSNSALGAEIEACKCMWQTIGEIEDNKPKALCVDSKNLVDMYDKAKAGIWDDRGGFETIKDLTVRFPLIKLMYVHRRWNREADIWAKIGLRRDRTTKNGFNSVL